jgi:X-Pro dipeptidyl-peptidase
MLDRPAPVLVAAVAGLALAAGCIGGGDEADLDQADKEERLPDEALTQPVHDTLQRTEHVVQDEVQGEETSEIWLDVYRPEDVEDAPVILVFTPYQAVGDAGNAPGTLGNGSAPSQAPYDESLVHFFVPHGYAVAFADVPGNHNSGGCIDQSGPDQWRDGYAVVRWLAERDWSNGRVGMYGASYDGETQLTTALLDPPGLATIVPTASVDSQYKYLHYGGVPYELQGAGTMVAYLAISAVPGTHPNAATTYHERFTCQPDNLQRALDTSGDWTPYWEDRAYHELADQANVSMLRVHGFQDWNVKPDHIDPSTEDWGGEPVRALYGQWGHAYPDRDDWWGHGDMLHRWFDHFLTERDTGIVDATPPVLAEDTAGDWHGLDAFPPEDGPALTLHPTEDGRLVDATNGTGERTVADPPRDPPGLATRETLAPVGENATGAPTELVFTSEPLDQRRVLAGRPTVSFTATTDAESTHWVAHLEVVGGDGEGEWINRGYLDAVQRNGLEENEPLTPGEPYDATVEMFPQTDVVEPGDRLRLVVSNTDDWVHQDDSYATSTVETGAGAELVLPLLPAEASSHDAERLSALD